ncbi:MAG: hypothetical protein LBJ59_11945 [Zoogloeaceae bacterium]|jgi:hypothetical protein|nr:hypothetical protein [Zoogloeaceae bacterium]
MKNILAILSACLLAACATQPIPTSEATPVPAGRIHSQALTAPQEGTGQVIVKRDRGFFGSGCTIRVLIDDIPAASIDTEEKITLYPQEGIRILGIEGRGGLCTKRRKEIEITVSHERPLVYRITTEQRNGIMLYPTR